MTDPLLLALPDTIDTARLLLRVPAAGDGPQLHAAVAESLPALRQFLGMLPWVSNEPTTASSELRCRTGHANFIARTDLPFLIFDKASNALVGGAGLHRTQWSTPRTEVGYWVRSSRTGHGFIAEAVDALAAYAFKHMHAVRVELITDEANAPSRRVAERCQFMLEGILRNDRRAPDGSIRNTCMYARFPPAVQVSR